jgi:hypothetical protein
MPGEQIDGMDVISVYETMKQAVERARSGEGPTLVGDQNLSFPRPLYDGPLLLSYS